MKATSLCDINGRTFQMGDMVVVSGTYEQHYDGIYCVLGLNDDYVALYKDKHSEARGRLISGWPVIYEERHYELWPLPEKELAYNKEHSTIRIDDSISPAGFLSHFFQHFDRHTKGIATMKKQGSDTRKREQTRRDYADAINRMTRRIAAQA